ncbi:hypothetical protein Amac_038430 [Acrocarpospora macrocephala]|uniref:Uncharacterized protein n=1 Tax=Acrocarpospora macrocephala TaxID=150177 RepID=A0A5M3WNR5_9ACTN|nr:hypothetical protein Amac_038430 [Acrocarpospora macrocephala]
MNETALARVGSRPAIGITLGQLVEIPVTISGKARNGVPAFGDEPPQILRRGKTAGEPAAHRHDGDRLGGDRDQLLVLAPQSFRLLHGRPERLNHLLTGRIHHNLRASSEAAKGRGDPGRTSQEEVAEHAIRWRSETGGDPANA